MENHHRHTNPSDVSPTPGKRSQTDQRWTLLFIGNHGKTITLKRFKTIVLLTGLVLVVSVAITIGLLYFSFNVHQKKNLLETEIQDLKDQVKALRYEKDVLMTKLVLAESRTEQNPAETKKETTVPDSSPEKKVELANPPAAAQIAKTTQAPPLKKTVKSPPGAPVSAPALSVDIENFKLIPKTDENLLRVQFKIKNTTPQSQRVSGHTIVVLKSDSSRPDQWLTIPAMALSNGKPTGRRKGYAFGINHFKNMKLKANLPKSPEIYRNATVYVFTRQGDLLLEKDFPINLPPVQSRPTVVPATPTPTAATAPPAAKPPAAASPTQPAPSDNAMPSTGEPMNTLKNTKTE